MKHALLAAALTALAACGNYSNDDLQFLDALPDRQALSTQVPQGSAQALSQTASLYTGTVQTAQTINAGVESIIALLDLVRTLPPSQRGPDLRVWGPFNDTDPGFENQVVIRRSANTFNYELQQRAKGGEFVDVLTGTFVGDTALAGHGTLDFEVAPLESIGHTQRDPNLRSLRFVYANDTQPRTVNTTIVSRDAEHAQTTTLSYLYAEAPAEGDLDFDLQGPSGNGTYDIQVHSRWVPDGGAGRALGVGTLAAFTGLELQVDQCWDDQFLETYYDSRLGRALEDGGLGVGATASVGCDGAGEVCPRGAPAACPF